MAPLLLGTGCAPWTGKAAYTSRAKRVLLGSASISGTLREIQIWRDGGVALAR